MSQLQSGNRYDKHSVVFHVDDQTQVGSARRFANSICTELKFETTRRARVGIIVNELGNNLVRYAPGGSLIFRQIDDLYQTGFEILSVDRGRGFDASVVMLDGYTTGSTPGTGLGAVKRQSDLFDVYAVPGAGAVVVSRVFATDEDAQVALLYDVGAITVPMKHEEVCGDAWAVCQNDSEICILVVDGLGHGVHAHEAALEAVGVFENSKQVSLDILLTMIHNRLKSTRGGAVFLATAKPTSIDFAGAGNIRAIIQSAETMKTLISQNGTAGIQIRGVQVRSQPWDGVGYLVIHSDGITTRCDLSKYPGLVGRHPSLVCAVIYRDFERGNDDTTVLVVRKSL